MSREKTFKQLKILFHWAPEKIKKGGGEAKFAHPVPWQRPALCVRAVSGNQ